MGTSVAASTPTTRATWHFPDRTESSCQGRVPGARGARRRSARVPAPALARRAWPDPRGLHMRGELPASEKNLLTRPGDVHPAAHNRPHRRSPVEVRESKNNGYSCLALSRRATPPYTQKAAVLAASRQRCWPSPVSKQSRRSARVPAQVTGTPDRLPANPTSPVGWHTSTTHRGCRHHRLGNVAGGRRAEARGQRESAGPLRAAHASVSSTMPTASRARS